MEELQISSAWLAVLGSQLTLVMAFAAFVFKTGITRKEIENVIAIVKRHAHTDYIPHLMAGTDECEHQLREDHNKIIKKHFWVVGIGAVVIIFTFFLAAFIGSISNTIRTINTNSTSYHQEREILAVTPADWDKEVEKLGNSQKKNSPNSIPINLVIDQDAIGKFKRLVFVEDYSWHYEAALMMILLMSTSLPLFWAYRIKRRVFRNSAYIAASYSYAASQVITDHLNASIGKLEDLYGEHQETCRNYCA
jgi:hypothetical protein